MERVASFAPFSSNDFSFSSVKDSKKPMSSVERNESKEPETEKSSPVQSSKESNDSGNKVDKKEEEHSNKSFKSVMENSDKNKESDKKETIEEPLLVDLAFDEVMEDKEKKIETDDPKDKKVEELILNAISTPVADIKSNEIISENIPQSEDPILDPSKTLMSEVNVLPSEVNEDQSMVDIDPNEINPKDILDILKNNQKGPSEFKIKYVLEMDYQKNPESEEINFSMSESLFQLQAWAGESSDDFFEKIILQPKMSLESDDSQVHVISQPMTQPVPVAQVVDKVERPMNDPSWSADLFEKVMWMGNQHISSAKIAINPPHLGPIEIHIDMEANRANVSFFSAHQVVCDAIQKDFGLLKDMLQQQGIEMGQASVSSQYADQQNSNPSSQSQSFSDQYNERMEKVEQLRRQTLSNEAKSVQTDSVVDYYA